MHVTMRSNDVFRGLPYDAWMFSNAQHAVAYALGVEVGAYYHTAFSLHAYIDKDLDKLKALHSYDMAASPPMFPPSGEPGGATPAARWARVSYWARVVMGLGRDRDEDRALPLSVSWHRDVLSPHWSGGLLCPACRYVLPKTEEYFYLYEHKTYSNRLVCRFCRMLRRRGLAPDDYERLLFEQGHACAVCEEIKPLVIDHDHETNTTRGLVCRTCNQLLGIMDQRSKFFNSAQKYLDKSKEAIR